MQMLYIRLRVMTTHSALVAMIPCTEFGFTSTDGLNVACARWFVENQLVGYPRCWNDKDNFLFVTLTRTG